jgi:hypothetical protein
LEVFIAEPCSADVVERHAAGFSHARHRVFDLVLDQIGIDQAGEVAASPWLQTSRLCVPGVTSIGPLEKIAMIQQHPDGENVVIGVRIERPVLMPFHRRAVLRRLHVEFEPCSRRPGPSNFVRMSTTGALRTIWSNSASTLCGALPRGFRGVTGLEVVDVGVFEVLVSAVICSQQAESCIADLHSLGLAR